MNINFLRVVTLIVAAMGFMPVWAARTFYDSKSWIVNVAGDYQFLQQLGLESKVNGLNIPVPVQLGGKATKLECLSIETKLNEMKFGNTVINAITANGTSDAYLRQLALANANRNDIELGAENMRSENSSGLMTLLQDDYEPILMHNYIALFNRVEMRDSKGVIMRDRDGNIRYKCNYAIYKVEVSKEEAFDIVSNISQAAYSQLPKFRVKLMDFGSYELSSPEKAVNRISKNVPGLALRGTIIRRNPARISIGEDKGIKKGDLVSTYSQRMDKKGNMYSKRISRARVCGVWENEAQVNFEAGTAGNRKNGDIVVRTPDSHFRTGLIGTWMPHVWGGELMFDLKSGFTRAGIIHHILADLSFSMTDHPGDKFRLLYGYNPDHDFLAPMFMNVGMGYGISKTFVGYFDIMPFFLIQYEMGLMVNTSKDAYDIGNGYDSTVSGAEKAVLGSSIRIPVGVRFSFNIAYPFKLVVEAGYAPCFGFGDDYKIIKATNKYIGAKRDGIFINAGFMF
ncbi:MAG: hypothetical protein K2H35_01990 [Muribaculaceae bacterium]|nr:hypothetical protein [Muribaculaceae bacterium]MDE6558977.1 hypothetical protein [Muribaculaceae bacterium]